jgi:hypothetical protein
MSPSTLQNCSPFSPFAGRLAPVPTGSMKTRSVTSRIEFGFGTTAACGAGWSPLGSSSTFFGPSPPKCSHTAEEPGPPLKQKVIGRLALPMKTSWLVRFSSFSQSRSQRIVKRLFTPWKMARRGIAADREEAFRAIDFFLFGERCTKNSNFSTLNGRSNSKAERLDVVMVPVLEFVEEFGIDAELLVHVEGVHVEQLLEVHLRVVRAENLRVRVEFAALVSTFVELLSA